MTPETLGRTLRSIRERRGLTIEQVSRAKRGSPSGAAISKVERGMHYPGLLTLLALADVYAVEFRVRGSGLNIVPNEAREVAL